MVLLFLFLPYFLWTETLAPSARNAAVALPPPIGCDAPVSWSSIWRVLRATRAVGSCPPVSSLRCSTIGCCAKRTIWRPSMAEQHPVMVGGPRSAFLDDGVMGIVYYIL